jgi:hypothetical protein
VQQPTCSRLRAVRSPESNGIAETFVKTFKRDYARLSSLPDAATVIALLPAWFENYSEVHPHSGLKLLYPKRISSPQFLAHTLFRDRDDQIKDFQEDALSSFYNRNLEYCHLWLNLGCR